jgi:hypothetical protein
LINFQTAIVQGQPGFDALGLQEDVPYHAMQCTISAPVKAHVDGDDMLGGIIAWLSCGSSGSAPGGAFVLYSLGVKVPVAHLAHMWLRSDRIVHGTVRGLATEADAAVLGLGLYNKGAVLKGVCKVLNRGGKDTWSDPYVTDKRWYMPRDLGALLGKAGAKK